MSRRLGKPLFSGSFRILAIALGTMSVLVASAGAREQSKPVDRPQTKIAFGPGQSARQATIKKWSSARFRFRSDERRSSFRCRVDRRPWHRCSSPVRIRVRPGKHRFLVRARDRDGNLDRKAAWRSWRAKRWEPHIRTARRYARRRAGPVSVAVDVGWRTRGYRPSLTAPTASTIKVMLMVAYLRRKGVRHRSLTGSEKNLLGRMIRVSDNGAATAVRDLDGARSIIRLARRAGMEDFDYSPIWGICRTSARDQASFMRRIRQFIPKRHERFALGQLGHISSRQSWGIGKLPLTGWKVRFKGGWGISDGGYGGVVNHQVVQLTHGKWKIGVAALTMGNPNTEYGAVTLKGVFSRLLGGLPH
jgi:hypothetical protein